MRLPDNYYNGECYWAHMISLRCNGGCPYCLTHCRGRAHGYEELSGREILSIWNMIEEHSGRDLSIIGGEPTLHPDFTEIIHGLNGYRVTITSNLATKFFNRDDFWKDLIVPYWLRMNTTFHPSSGITLETYINRIKVMQENDILVDQIGMVDHPEFNKAEWAGRFSQLGVHVQFFPFIGFWNKEESFSAKPCPENLYPNEMTDNSVFSICGIHSLDVYKERCGMIESKPKDCSAGTLCFLVAPDGSIHECHYKLYNNVDSKGNIFEDWEPATVGHSCDHYGHCHGCDFSRLRKVMRD